MNEGALYPRLAKAESREPRLSPAWVTFDRNPADGPFVTVCFIAQDASSQLEQRVESRRLSVPKGFDPSVAAERLGCALAAVLRLDAMNKRRYCRGHSVKIQVPVTTPRPLPTSFLRGDEEEYWRLRVPIGVLVRPLLLAAPNLGHLFPYQREGALWLTNTESGILADDMGLGKTVQAITALRIFFFRGTVASALVLCPKSVIANWEDELTRWAPELTRVRVVPTGSERDQVWKTILRRVHVCIANYEQIRQPPLPLVRNGVDVIVVDEAHRIRNLASLATQGIRRIPSKRFWALTGTPIERDAEDLATLLSTVDPQRFAVSDADQELSVLRASAQQYILRRRKETVLPELPPVIESVETIELLPSQWTMYRKAVRSASPESREPAAFIALINKLRRICDYDPRTLASAKVDRAAEIIADIADVKEKCVVFSYLLKPLKILQLRLQETLGKESSLILQGALSMSQRETVLARFKSEPRVVALLASSRVGGEGLTLTEANHAIFLNEWWNPSANAQARDRIVRIGQTRVVRVHRFVCRGTVEELLQQILQEKGRTFADVIDRLAQPAPSDTEILEIAKALEARLFHSSAQ